MKYEGHIEFTVIERTDERVVSEMPVTDGIRNPYGVANAGALLWHADVTASILVAGGKPMGVGAKGFPLAISLNANFLSNQTDGVFRAVSTFVKRGRTLSVVRTLVYGADEKLMTDVTTSHVLAK